MLNKYVQHREEERESIKRQKEIAEMFSDSNFSSDARYTKDTFIEGKCIIRSNANIKDSKIGFGTLIGFNSDLYNSKIGRFCSIASNVKICPFTHPSDFVSTNVSFYNTINTNVPFGKSKTDVKESLTTPDGYFTEIGNDVWIGEDVLIKGGVKIGDGAIIGMRALVTKDVPPYAIVGGVPAKIIRNRFDEKTVDALLKIQWWNWPVDLIDERREDFADIESFIKKYSNR